MEDVYLSDKMIDPVTYCKPYFSRLTDRQLATLIGSIALLRRVDLKVLVSLLDMSKIEVEEKVGRLLQTDIFNGEFEGNQFVLNNLNYQFL
ncbi:MAG: hypothetical protein IH840_09480, partial [Candidatus Heimdallarchaeota archaeon]|nr:hypothetical protein [Candidatus Heimdallarchaeota archaeon]